MVLGKDNGADIVGMEVLWPTRYVLSRRSPRESPIAEALRRSPLFADLDSERLLDFARVCSVKQYPKRSAIVRDGDSAPFLYVVLSGVVASHRLLVGGRETILSLLRDPAFFGEWCVSGVAAPYGVYALTDAQVAVVPAAAFDELLTTHSMVSRMFALGVESRFRSAHERSSSIASHDVTARIARLLLSLSESFATEQPDGTLRIWLRLTNSEMANMVATTRETVNRTLNRFWDQKIVDMRSAQIVVKDLDTLRTLCGDPLRPSLTVESKLDILSRRKSLANLG